MFKSYSYQYKQTCLKFFFGHLFQAVAKNIWKPEKKICLVWHSKKISIIPVERNSSMTALPCGISNL